MSAYFPEVGAGTGDTNMTLVSLPPLANGLGINASSGEMRVRDSFDPVLQCVLRPDYLAQKKEVKDEIFSRP